MRLSPVVWNTKELDHIFLLIGKSRFHNWARARNPIPTHANKPAFLFGSKILFFKNVPVKIPPNAVLIAGILLKNPTVSCIPSESLPGKMVRSTYEAKFPCIVRSPGGKPGAEVNFNISQYPISRPKNQIIWARSLVYRKMMFASM